MKVTLVLYEDKSWPEIRRWIKKHIDEDYIFPNISGFVFELKDKDEKVKIVLIERFRCIDKSFAADKLLVFGILCKQDIKMMSDKIIFK